MDPNLYDNIQYYYPRTREGKRNKYNNHLSSNNICDAILNHKLKINLVINYQITFFLHHYEVGTFLE